MYNSPFLFRDPILNRIELTKKKGRSGNCYFRWTVNSTQPFKMSKSSKKQNNCGSSKKQDNCGKISTNREIKSFKKHTKTNPHNVTFSTRPFAR